MAKLKKVTLTVNGRMRTVNALEDTLFLWVLRELGNCKNVVERSVIVCETETFSVDESWFARQDPPTEAIVRPLSHMLPNDEKALIEGALAETCGRVSGPAGAAVKLGLPASTLESKIRGLKINKHQFKCP